MQRAERRSHERRDNGRCSSTIFCHHDGVFIWLHNEGHVARLMQTNFCPGYRSIRSSCDAGNAVRSGQHTSPPCYPTHAGRSLLYLSRETMYHADETKVRLRPRKCSTDLDVVMEEEKSGFSFSNQPNQSSACLVHTRTLPPRCFCVTFFSSPRWQRWFVGNVSMVGEGQNRGQYTMLLSFGASLRPARPCHPRVLLRDSITSDS